MLDPGSLRHVAVIDTPKRTVKKFYEQLGFTEVVATERPAVAYMEELSDGVLSSVAIEKLRNNQGLTLEIITVLDPGFSIAVSWTHFALSTDFLKGIVSRVKDLGGTIVGGPVASPDGPYMVAYARDPAGNLMELVQHVDKRID